MTTSLTAPDSPTILVIDDEAAVRNSVCYFLSDHGYRTLEAEDGETGLALLIKQPDLVLLDLRMPGMSGLEFLRRAREPDPDLAIIVISGTGLINDAISALQLGARDFLLKPIHNLDILKHSVERALEGARLRKENLAYQNSLEELVFNRTRSLEEVNQQLLTSEAKYRAIYENLQDIYYEVALDGLLLEVSPSVSNSTLYSREELIGTSIWDYYADRSQRERFLELITKEGRVSDYEICLVNKDGQPIYFSVNARLHQSTAERPAYIAGILRDINRRKQAEAELLDSKQTIEALIDAAPLAIIAVDLAHRITIWNRMAEQIFGWSYAEIIGQPYPLAAVGHEAEATLNLDRALEGNNFIGLEVKRRHKDGHLVAISASTATLKNSMGETCGLIIIIEDISEKQRLRRQADQASRLASLGELAAGVAHEINNPNGLILLNLPTLRDFVMDVICHQEQQRPLLPDQPLAGLLPAQLADSIPRLLLDMEDGARRIKQIVEDLKDFSRQPVDGQLESFDLNRAAKTALRLTGNNLKKATSRLRAEFAEDLPLVQGSSPRIEQVIVNLLINACESLTDQEQAIQVQTEFDPQKKEVCLTVHDQGRGIPAEQLQHITDPFFTTRRHNGGTGLGLSVSARIVKEHGGRLDFSSTPGKGTRVRMFLPVPAEG